MSQPIVLTKQQQQAFAQRMNDEMARNIMSWDNELRSWYALAVKSLEYANPITLNIPQSKFVELFAQEPQGLNMNVVMILCNCLEFRTPKEMNYTAEAWAEVLLMNQRIADRWNQMKFPIEKKVWKEFEIMSRQPVIHKIGEA